MHSWGPSQSPRNRTDPPTPLGVGSLGYPAFTLWGIGRSTRQVWSAVVLSGEYGNAVYTHASQVE